MVERVPGGDIEGRPRGLKPVPRAVERRLVGCFCR